MSLGLYIHIPFCVSKCPYCDFSTVVGRDHLSSRYVDALVREVRERIPQSHSHPVRFDTIYFGGGTPTSLSTAEIGRILEAVRTAGEVSEGVEITLEANPESAGPVKFRELRDLGVNRLSIGLQSFDDEDLRILGRAHSSEEAIRTYRSARAAGFNNLNLDLIFALAGQTESRWGSQLKRLVSLAPDHVSVYQLTVEPGTEFGRLHRNGELSTLSEEAQAAMYGEAVDRLTDAGYVHYEISNFCLPGCQSRHNLKYWDGSDYLGLGLSAHSFEKGRRSWNVRGLTEYLERIEEGGTAVGGLESLSDSERRSESILLGLRKIREGTPWVPAEKDPAERRRAEGMVEAELLEAVDGRLRLTRKGLMVADAVAVELVRE